ncbi:sphingomyelin phosphodiesterase 4-like [Glandiceps talaboti]
MRFQLAISKALKQRCDEMTNIINDCSTRELHTIFPLLLESLFGFNNSPGWGLKTVTRQTHPVEFQALRMFLSPTGALMNMVHKLQSDSYMRYEFLVSCLPIPSRHSLQEGIIPLLYSNKLSYQTQGRPPNAISLNAFEYYLFHFAYFIVYPKNKNLNLWANPIDCIYPCVLEDYLNYFLPLDNYSGVVSGGASNLSSPTHSPQSPYSRIPQNGILYSYFLQSPSVSSSHASNVHASQWSHSVHPKSPSFGPLIRGSLPGHGRSPTCKAAMKTDATGQEQWKSDTFAQILAEFWLNQNSLDQQDRTLSEQFSENFLPSPDHVRVVRMLVKHVHFFVNTLKSTPITSPYQQHIDLPLDDLKRSIIPHILQKKLYAFLRHGFDKWPFDASFRLMLETWLSFIQPWRYTEDGRFNVGFEKKDGRDRSVSTQWEQVIIERLLFYTTLFIEFLPRAFRQDLSSSKNAYMLFRVCKVYSQINLSNMIEEAEGLLYEEASVGFIRPPSSDGSYLATPRPPSGASLRLQVAELEGQGFIYKPLFSEEMQRLIEQLLGRLQHAQNTLKSLSSSNGEDTGGILSLLGFKGLMDYNSQGTMSNSYRDHDIFDEPYLDIKKVDSYLQQSLNYLSRIFKVEPSSGNETMMPWDTINNSKYNITNSCSQPDMMDGTLTPLGRYQLMNGLRKFDIMYQGDPDLQPIRSHENPELVRLLYRLSSNINKHVGDKIDEWCSRTDLIGQLAKVYFNAPSTSSCQTCVDFTKSSPSTLKKMSTLKPRLSLRFLASYQNMGYLLAFMMFCYVYDIRFTFIICLLMLIVLIYGLIKVFMTSVQTKH